MSKKTILFFIGFVLLPWHISYAQVVWSEIAWKGMPTGATHEWLELFNSGSSTENISGWTIKDGIDQLNITIPTDTTISAGGFYVIKRNTSTITPFNLSVSFNGGLADSGEKLILRDSVGAEVDTADFSEGWPDEGMTSEYTMQKDGSSWFTATPTPGAENADASSGNDSGNNSNDDESDTSSSNNTSNSSSGSTTSKKSESKNSNPKVEIISPKIAFVGIPFDIQAKIVNNSGGRYFWNFGDGNAKQEKDTRIFSHTYLYEGEYIISLGYYRNNFSKAPEAIDKKTIKVVPLSVSISKVGDKNDFFVELSNNNNYEMDISGWALSSLDKTFVLPRDSNILAKKKIMLSPQITNFDVSDTNNLKLNNKTGEIVFDYGASYSKPKVVAKKTVKTNAPKTEEVLAVETFIPPADLSASVISSDITREDSNNSYFWMVISFVFIAFSAGAVYFIRRGSHKSIAGEDFDILDE